MFFVLQDSASTEFYTLSLHDALPIWSSFGGDHGERLSEGIRGADSAGADWAACGYYADRGVFGVAGFGVDHGDRKSTRLNSSHLGISYAVFCLKKKRAEVKEYSSHWY